MPRRSANSISGSVLPTPAKAQIFGGPPAATTRRNSPSLTTSKPLPRLASARSLGANFRRTAGGNHPTQFAFADNIEATAEAGERAQHGDIGVRLDRITDEVVQRRQCGIELAEMTRQRALRIDIRRRGVLSDERFDGNAFATKLAGPVTATLAGRH